MNRAEINWCKTFLRDTNADLHNIGQAASMRRPYEQRTLGERVHAPDAARRQLEQTDNYDLGTRVFTKREQETTKTREVTREPVRSW
jgi:hypothetical protein